MFKIAMREVVNHELDWDAPLPDDLQARWTSLMTAAVTNEPLTFPRSLKTGSCTDAVELIGFWDGSDVAYGCVLYARWMLQDQEGWHTALVGSKSRVTPRAGCTTPRAELSGLVMLTRLVKSVVTALKTTPRRITLAGDSTCTISACEINCASLQPFFSNRVMEILANLADVGEETSIPVNQELPTDQEVKVTQIDKLQHIKGVSNPADWPSRGNLEWQDLGGQTESWLR